MSDKTHRIKSVRFRCLNGLSIYRDCFYSTIDCKAFWSLAILYRLTVQSVLNRQDIYAVKGNYGIRISKG